MRPGASSDPGGSGGPRPMLAKSRRAANATFGPWLAGRCKATGSRQGGGHTGRATGRACNPRPPGRLKRTARDATRLHNPQDMHEKPVPPTGARTRMEDGVSGLLVGPPAPLRLEVAIWAAATTA